MSPVVLNDVQTQVAGSLSAPKTLLSNLDKATGEEDAMHRVSDRRCYIG